MFELLLLLVGMLVGMTAAVLAAGLERRMAEKRLTAEQSARIDQRLICLACERPIEATAANRLVR